MKTYKVIVDEKGDIRWYNEYGQYHREDGPAVEWKDGNKWWYINGDCHREDGPAIEYASGKKFWYLYGMLYNTEEEWKAALTKLKGPTQEEINKALEVLSKATGYKIIKV